MNKRIWVLGATLGVVAIATGILANTNFVQPTAATAASADYFLKLDGIPGTSGNSSHNGEIEVMSWSFGASNPSVSNGSGGMGAGVGKVSGKGFTIRKELDKASPLLYKAQVSSQHIKNATFTVNLMGSSEYITIHMSDVIVSSYTMAGDQGYRPTETVSFNYGKIEITWPASMGGGTTSNPAALPATTNSSAGTTTR